MSANVQPLSMLSSAWTVYGPPPTPLHLKKSNRHRESPTTMASLPDGQYVQNSSPIWIKCFCYMTLSFVPRDHIMVISFNDSYADPAARIHVVFRHYLCALVCPSSCRSVDALYIPFAKCTTFMRSLNIISNYYLYKTIMIVIVHTKFLLFSFCVVEFWRSFVHLR